jgi:hypothetical protein
MATKKKAGKKGNGKPPMRRAVAGDPIIINGGGGGGKKAGDKVVTISFDHTYVHQGPDRWTDPDSRLNTIEVNQVGNDLPPRSLNANDLVTIKCTNSTGNIAIVGDGASSTIKFSPEDYPSGNGKHVGQFEIKEICVGVTPIWLNVPGRECKIEVQTKKPG